MMEHSLPRAEKTVQLKVSKEAKRRIKALALERDQTIRDLILSSLIKEGLKIPAADRPQEDGRS